MEEPNSQSVQVHRERIEEPCDGIDALPDYRARSRIMAPLSEDQAVEIRRMLGEGMSPRDVADSIGRVAGLDPMEILELESVIDDLASS